MRLLHRVVDAYGFAANDDDRSSTDPCVFRAATRDHKAQSRPVKDGGLDWTIGHGAGVFTDSPHTGHYHAGPIISAADQRFSRSDLAHSARYRQ
jgi:hypothetical protein